MTTGENPKNTAPAICPGTKVVNSRTARKKVHPATTGARVRTMLNVTTGPKSHVMGAKSAAQKIQLALFNMLTPPWPTKSVLARNGLCPCWMAQGVQARKFRASLTSPH